MEQMHKRFTAEQVGVLLKGYCQGTLNRATIGEVLGIGKRFLALLEQYRCDPDKFSPQIAGIIAETVWHPSQVLEPQSDGALIMTLKVTNTIHLYAWILGWGEEVEVLEPAELRKKVVKTAKALLGVYAKEP